MAIVQSTYPNNNTIRTITHQTKNIIINELKTFMTSTKLREPMYQYRCAYMLKSDSDIKVLYKLLIELDKRSIKYDPDIKIDDGIWIVYSDTIFDINEIVL